MSATTPAATSIAPSDIEFDHGTFDSAAFAAQTLASWQSVAAVIDHTILKPEATRAQVELLCEEAAKYRFACAMVNPVWAATAVKALSGTGVPVGVVIGFPFGASLVSTLRHEAAALARQHNDSNVLVLGSKFVDEKDMLEIIKIWLLTEFEGGRHLRRKEQIQNIEREFSK